MIGRGRVGGFNDRAYHQCDLGGGDGLEEDTVRESRLRADFTCIE